MILSATQLKQRSEKAFRHAVHVEIIEKDLRKVRDAYLVAADAAEEAGDQDSAARDSARLLVMQCRYMLFPHEHVHACPECYEEEICSWTCSPIDYHEAYDNVKRGNHMLCNNCEAARLLIHESSLMNSG